MPEASIWLDRDERRPQRHPRLERDLEVDVAVIGGGIVGATTASLLSDDDVSVALVEARRIGSGTTGNSTGKATLFHGTGFRTLIDAVGVSRARSVLDADADALMALRNWSRLDLAPVEDVMHWAWASDDDSSRLLEQEAQAARELGINVRWAQPDECPFGRSALGVESQLLIEPGMLCPALASRAAARGVQVFEQTRIVHVDHGGDRLQLTTDTGIRLTARRVVLATQVPILDRTMVFAACSYRRSHAAALEVDNARHRFPAMYTGFGADGLSLRPARTRDGREVMVVAGHGHDLREDEDGTHVDQLIDHARRLIGSSAGAVTHRWLAHDAFPNDSRPFVGPALGMDDIYIATGFGGWGLARGIAGAQAIARHIASGGGDWNHPLDARRVAPYASKQTVTESARTAATFIGDRLSGADRAAVEQLEPGRGIVIDVGDGRVAISRGRDGALRATSARCTHLGCIVRFDAERESWQCPCHASRFAPDGSVLAGPAMEPLGQISLD